MLGDHEYVEPAKRLGVAGKSAVAGGNQDAAQFFAVTRPDLDDARIECASGAIGAENQLKTGGEIKIESAEGNGIEVGGWRFDEALHRLRGRARGDERGGAGGMEQAVGAEIVGVGVAGALTAEDADAAAGAGALRGGFDDLLIDSEGGGGDRFEVKIGVVAAGRERFAQAAFQQALGESEFIKEITLVALRAGKRPDWSSYLQFTPNRPAAQRRPVPLLVRGVSYSSAGAILRARFVP